MVIGGQDCRFNPFSSRGQATPCGALLDHFSRKGVRYETAAAPVAGVTIGGTRIDDTSAAGLDAALARAGYSFDRVNPTGRNLVKILFAISILAILAGMTYGPVAALLTELFPSRIRYSSLSIPYHIGTGYFGGFLPFISQYIIARTGDPYSGLWYTFSVVAVALVVSLAWLPETAGRQLD